MEKKRSNYIDLVKGLSILTLFFLHFENGYIITKYNFFLVRSPSFYMVVGWLWGMSKHKKTIQEHWKKRKEGLVKPYLWFSVIFLLFDLILILMGFATPFIFYRDLYKTICLRGIGTLWFLPALLGGEMIFLYIRDKRKYNSVLAYLFCFIIIIFYSYWLSCNFGKYTDIINAPFRALRDVSDCFIYLSIAFFISHKYGKMILEESSMRLFSIGFTLLLSDFLLINFCRSDFLLLDTLIFTICNVFAGLGIILLFKSVEDVRFLYPLIYLGKNSLIVMAVHYGLLIPIISLFHNYIFGTPYWGGITLAYFFIALILQILIIELINKKFPFVIGKGRTNGTN